MNPDPCLRPPGWRPLIAIALVAGLALACVSALYWNRTLDDSWITYRYGRNLAEGHGFQWNPDDARPFEAYTSFTHVLVTAGFELAGWDPVVSSKNLGLAANLLLLLVAASVVRSQDLGLAEMALAAAAFGGSVLLGFHAVTGKETPLYTLAVTLGTWGLIRAVTNERRAASAFALFVAGILTRPDCGLLFGAYTLILLVVHRRRWRVMSARVLGLLVLPGLLYVAFKWAVFGQILPNSFHFKVGGGTGPRLPGLVYVRDFCMWFLPGAAVWGAVLAARRKLAGWEWAALMALGATLLFYVKVAPKVGVGFRFLVPYYPSIVLLLLGGTFRLRDNGLPSARRWAVAIAALLLANHAAAAAVWGPRIRDYMAPRVVNPALGRALAGMENAASITLVTGEAGAIPYYSRMRHRDPYGLVSAEGAASPLDPGWVFDRPVDILVTHSIDVEPLPDGGWRVHADKMNAHLARPRSATDTLSYRLLAHPAMTRFSLVGRIPFRPDPRPEDHYVVFVNRAFLHADDVRRRIAGLRIP